MAKGEGLDNKIEEAWKSPYAEVSEQHIQKSWEELRQRIKVRPKGGKRSYFFIGYSIAATLLLLLCSYFLIENHNPTIVSENLSSIEKEVRLSDGSLVVLKPGALMTYKKFFKDDRAVSLQGEAFFEIAKDSLREFTVTTGISTIKVLGTSFLLKGEAENYAEVSLFTGRIKVSIKGVGQSWGLVPGEKLVYRHGDAFVASFNPELSYEKGNQNIDIMAMPMKEFIPFLEERYGFQFAPDSYLPENRVTLRINKEDSLEHILKLLMIITNTTYEINEKTKIIDTITE